MGRVGDMVVVGEREPVTVAWGSWRAAWRCCWWSWGVKCVKRGLVKNHWKACYPVRTSKSKGTHSLLCGRLLLFNCCGVWLSCDSMDYSPEFPDSSVGKESALQCRRLQFDSWVGKICWRRDRLPTPVFLGFPCDLAGKESSCSVRDLGSIPGSGRAPGEGNGYPLQDSGLENFMVCIVHGVAKS